ncbi:hypothetical protein AHAS_Ahas19G0285100 [Arachis hypogaea]
MMRHIHNCIRSDKNVSLTYGIFFTCFLENFGVDLTNENQENKTSYFKGGRVVKQTKGKGTKAARDMVMEEEDVESIPLPSAAGTSSFNKYLVNGIVNDVLQEFVNVTMHMINLIKQARKLAILNENSLRKFQSRVEVLLKYIESLKDDPMQLD